MAVLHSISPDRFAGLVALIGSIHRGHKHSSCILGFSLQPQHDIPGLPKTVGICKIKSRPPHIELSNQMTNPNFDVAGLPLGGVKAKSNERNET
ncbi:unnamed protein product [Caretta caretta]